VSKKCDREAWTIRRPWPTRGCRAMKRNITAITTSCRTSHNCTSEIKELHLRHIGLNKSVLKGGRGGEEEEEEEEEDRHVQHSRPLYCIWLVKGFLAGTEAVPR
jgi:hypothetical protein